SAPQGGTLAFTYVGYTEKSIAITGQNVINITLEANTTGLDEIVVVGYGTQRKSVVTGAISTVSAKDLKDQQVTRLDDALQGRTAGVTVVQSSGAPGSSPTVRIRGTTSINNSDPLYVIDGLVVLNGGLDNINPDAIESIEVLKDASAAIYGSRASSGVILVTTKKGKIGNTTINYNGYIGYQQPVKHVGVTNATQYATLRNMSLTNDGAAAPFANPASFGTGTDWQNQIFGNARIQNNNLSISGGTDKSTYYAGFGYLDQAGIIEPGRSDYKRYNFTFNSVSKIKKWLTIGESFNYTYTRTLGGFNTNSEFGGPLSDALNLDPTTPVLQTNAAIAATYPALAVKNSAGIPYGISPYVAQEIVNPVAYSQVIAGNYNWAHNLLGNVYAEVEIIPGLKLKTQYSAKQAFFGGDGFTPLYYLNASTSNSSLTSANRSNNRNFTYTWDNTATYNKTIGLHSLNVVVGTSSFSASAVNLSTTYTGLPYTNFSQLSFNPSLSAANRIGSSSEDQPYTVASIFGRVTYDYDQKYLFSGIIRRDGSSRFGSNNVYGVFPGGELGWVATREKWFPKDSFVDFLKFRGSYGIIGNEQSLGPFKYTSVVTTGSNYIIGPDGLAVGAAPGQPANPNLKWEELHTTDIGFDAIILHNFNVTFDVYRKFTKGMLETQPIPAYTGFPNSPVANVGNMLNKGVELELGYTGKSGDFNYHVNGNIAYNFNQVTSLGTIPYIDGGSFQSSSYNLNRTQVGQSVNAFYGFKEVGIFQSAAQIASLPHLAGAKPGDFIWQDTDGNGKIDQADRQPLGSALPKYTYGMTFNASYKGFDVTIFGQGQWGNKVFEAYRRLDIPSANYPIEALNAWTPTNTNTNYPRLTDADPNNNFKYPSNFYLHNGGFFRIRTAQIGYNIKKSWLQKADIQNLRIYVSSNNLATISGYNGYDPEVAGPPPPAGTTPVIGVDRGVYPLARTFMVGLNITL
ncbi:MAG: SusC/RagA family TonB-linked outer membrane protein, partial [Mucilaginibacter sp.]|nr:SusC/RagA family TonB-linked outer membrane protein [Mucilaginibacter sp.]